MKDYFRKLKQKFNCYLLSSSLEGILAQDYIVSCHPNECKRCDDVRLRRS